MQLTYIPISALYWENIVQSSRFTPWFEGPSVLGYLEGLSPERDVPVEKVRAVVQWIERSRRVRRSDERNASAVSSSVDDPTSAWRSPLPGRGSALDYVPL